MLTEQVFTIPGFGKLIVDSVFNRDYAVVQGVVLVTATAYIVLNLLADLAYFAANPPPALVTTTAVLPGPGAAPVSRTVDAGPWQRAWRRLRRRRGALSGLVVVLLFIALALFAPWLAPFDPIETSWSAIRQAPSRTHWFGTDDIGRDVLSRVIWGTARVAARRRRLGLDLARRRRADRAPSPATSAALSTA